LPSATSFSADDPVFSLCTADSANCHQRRAGVTTKTNPAAYDLVQRGNWHHNIFTAADAEEAQRLYSAAIEADSNYARAYSGMASTKFWAAQMKWADDPQSRKRMRNAQYLRAQAEFCLQAARRISDHKTVENLNVDAARYHAEATEVEAARAGSKSDVFSLERDRPVGLGSWDEERPYVRLLQDLREGLQAMYDKDRAQPLPSRMLDLLKALEDRMLPDTD
jgi:hypothetical protein